MRAIPNSPARWISDMADLRVCAILITLLSPYIRPESYGNAEISEDHGGDRHGCPLEGAESAAHEGRQGDGQRRPARGQPDASAPRRSRLPARWEAACSGRGNVGGLARATSLASRLDAGLPDRLLDLGRRKALAG